MWSRPDVIGLSADYVLGSLQVGLAISFALPTFAQQKEPTLSEQDRQQLGALATKYADAVNKNDAAAIAALFTEDVKFVTAGGIISGREAIEKTYQGYSKATPFPAWPSRPSTCTARATWLQQLLRHVRERRIKIDLNPGGF